VVGGFSGESFELEKGCICVVMCDIKDEKKKMEMLCHGVYV
jgi:hypothetical protein